MYDNDDGPFELVYCNQETGHFAVFVNRLQFQKKWHAMLYAHLHRRTPPGITWLCLFYRDAKEIINNPARVGFEQLLEEAHKTDVYGNQWELLLSHNDTGALYRHYMQLSDYYGTYDIARQYAAYIAPPRGFSWIVLEARSTKNCKIEFYKKAPGYET
jgi:hypothetical protein